MLNGVRYSVTLLIIAASVTSSFDGDTWALEGVL